jgi:hypothetical protein
MIVLAVMVVAMVFTVPVAFMHLPATIIMVVVRMAPVGSRIGRPLPDPGDPDIPPAAITPIAVDPSIAVSRDRWPYLIAYGWWRRADVDVDLAECRNG